MARSRVPARGAAGGVASHPWVRAPGRSRIDPRHHTQPIDGNCSLPEAIYAANFGDSIGVDPPNRSQIITTGCEPGNGADTIVLEDGASDWVS